MKGLTKTKGWVAVLLLLTGMVGSGVHATDIAATRHNLSTSNSFANAIDGVSATVKSSNYDEICVFCHTPHAALKNNNITLWNKKLSTAASGAYTLYQSPTMTTGIVVSPGNSGDQATATVSNLCLSCHDGVVAVNSLNNASNRYGNADPTMLNATLSATTNLGTDLANDHPVNFPYDDSVAADSGFKAVATVNGGTAARLFLDSTTSKYTVQCASCHDAHGSADSYGGKQVAFLRSTMAGSALCLACHTK